MSKNKLWWVLFFVGCAIPSLAQIPNPGSEGKIPLKWISDFDAALKQAEQEKKPILIDVTTDWCGWSKKMDRETFADKEVQKILKNFLLIRLNPESSPKNEKTAEGFGVSGYPTLLIVNFKGEAIGEQSGFLAAKEMLEFLQKHLPLFKGNPMGYREARLPADDPFFKALTRLPDPEAMGEKVSHLQLLDYDTTHILSSGKIKSVIRSAYFILEPEAMDIPGVGHVYDSFRQKFALKTVRILNTNGVGREVDVRLAKEENVYSSESIYWDVKRCNLDLPKLKKGQVLDVIEEIEETPILPKQYFLRWNTGVKILVDSDLTITFPAGLAMEKTPCRCATPVKETRNADGTVTWSLKTSNTNLFEPELFCEPLDLFEGCLFATHCTKDLIAEWYDGLCKGRDVLPDSAKARLKEIQRTNQTQVAQLQAVLDWVTKDIRYVGVMFKASSHQPHPVKDTLANKYGDCKDQSLLVRSLCRELGIPASLVLVGREFAEMESASPSASMFDHCIVEAMVAGKPYYLDPAAGPAKLGELPLVYAGSRVLKLDGPRGLEVKLPSYQPKQPQEQSRTKVELQLSGGAIVTETYTAEGDAVERIKKGTKEFNLEKMRRAIEENFKRSGCKLLEFSMTDPTTATNLIQRKAWFTIPRYGTKVGDSLVFKLGQQENNNRWVEMLAEPRTKPFRFRASDFGRTHLEVVLPPGAKLKEKPASLELDEPFMAVTRKVVFADNTLTLEEYSNMREARLDAGEAQRVYKAFRKLQDHREQAYMVEMPKEP